MQSVILFLLINGLMAALLLATMVYCLRLNGRIKVLQDSKSELARIIQEFDESTQRATQSIADIHAATSRLSDNIQHKIDKANFLADDLQYMIEKGQKMTGKVDPAPAPSATPRTPASSAPSRSTFAPTGDDAKASATTPHSARTVSETMAALQGDAPRGGRTRSRAEQEIMNALGTKPKGDE